MRDGADVSQGGREDGAELGGKPARVGDDQILELVHHAKMQDHLVAMEELDHVFHLLELVEVAELRHQLGSLQEAHEVDVLLAHPLEPPDAPQPAERHLLPASLLHQLRDVLAQVLEVRLLAVERGTHQEALVGDKLLVRGSTDGLVESFEVSVGFESGHSVRVSPNEDYPWTPEGHVDVVLGPVEADVTEFGHDLLEVGSPRFQEGSAPRGGPVQGARREVFSDRSGDIYSQYADAGLWDKEVLDSCKWAASGNVNQPRIQFGGQCTPDAIHQLLLYFLNQALRKGRVLKLGQPDVPLRQWMGRRQRRRSGPTLQGNRRRDVVFLPPLSNAASDLGGERPDERLLLVWWGGGHGGHGMDA